MYTYSEIDGEIIRSDGIVVKKDLENPLFTEYVKNKYSTQQLSASKQSILTAIYDYNPAHYAAVMHFVNELSPRDFIVYDNGTNWKRNHPLIEHVINIELFKPEQVDAIFEAASRMDSERQV